MKQSDYLLELPNGCAPQIGNLIAMLELSKTEIIKPLISLSIKQLDFRINGKGNSIGTLIKHMMAVEYFYQVRTFNNRNMNDEENAFWEGALPGQLSSQSIKNNPLEYYVNLWNNVRETTYEELKQKDDNWLYEKVNLNLPEKGNNYWLWFHVMEDQICHRGQIKLILNELK